jgi:hypothetical protein
MPRIAVYTMAKNEAEHVGRFAATVRGADRVVVTDTGSTDGTPDLLRDAGIEVYTARIVPWRFDVASNVALAHVPDDVDVCVKLDLDEVLWTTDGSPWREEIERLWQPGVHRLRYWYTWSWQPRPKEPPKTGQAPGIHDPEPEVPKTGQAPGIHDPEPVPFSEAVRFRNENIHSRSDGKGMTGKRTSRGSQEACHGLTRPVACVSPLDIESCIPLEEPAGVSYTSGRNSTKPGTCRTVNPRGIYDKVNTALAARDVSRRITLLRSGSDGRWLAGPDRGLSARGKSGLRRTGWSVTPTGREARESATENRPPMARCARKVRRDQARVKRCGKSAPAAGAIRLAW